jgi:hypothetical protein
MAFMISKETENVQSSEEIEMAFTFQVKKSSIYRKQIACFSPEKSRPLRPVIICKVLSFPQKYRYGTVSRHFSVLFAYFQLFKGCSIKDAFN